MSKSAFQSQPFGGVELSTSKKAVGTFLAILGCNAVGLLGTLFTSTDTAWYTTLTKPSWQPPGWLFGPMWTLLYTLMGIALFRIWSRREEDGAKPALGFFAAKLVLNGIWSPIFFGAQAISVALVVIAMLAGVLALTIRQFWSLDRPAALMLVPYLAWVSFATILNAAIVSLN